MNTIRCNNCSADNKSNAKYCSQCGFELPIIGQNSRDIPDSDKIVREGNNKVRNTILGIVAGAIAYFAVQHFIFKAPSVDKVMMNAASELNKTCPIMIDQETRLDNALAMPNKAFQYNYTLINLDESEVNVDTLKKYIEPFIVNSIKTNPDMKMFRDNKVTMIYYYCDKDGDFVYKLSITPDMYE